MIPAAIAEAHSHTFSNPSNSPKPLGDFRANSCALFPLFHTNQPISPRLT